MVRRTASAPPRVTVASSSDGLGSSVTTDPTVDLSNSNGCGGESPTAMRFMFDRRFFLLNLMISWTPVFVVETFHGAIYTMIMWNPSHEHGGRIRGIARPQQWHTTLMRAVPSDLRLVESGMPSFQSIGQTLLDAMFAPLRDARGLLLSWLDLPPWARSWNFGCPTSLTFACVFVMGASEAWIQALDSRVVIRERRPFHISWH